MRVVSRLLPADAVEKNDIFFKIDDHGALLEQLHAQQAQYPDPPRIFNITEAYQVGFFIEIMQRAEGQFPCKYLAERNAAPRNGILPGIGNGRDGVIAEISDVQHQVAHLVEWDHERGGISRYQPDLNRMSPGQWPPAKSMCGNLFTQADAGGKK